MMPVAAPPAMPAVSEVAPRKTSGLRPVKKLLKRIVPLGLALYFIPLTFAIAFGIGLLDALRNRPWRLSTIDRYFAGNGVFTWLLSPFNLVMDLLSLPFTNKGVYKLEDLPVGYRDEIQTLIDAAYKRDLVGQLAAKMGDKKRGMIFFQWYGKILKPSVEMPEYQRRFKYIRTIGVSIFNKRSSTGKHFGPLRVTLRVLYNVNDITSPDVYVQCGDVVNRWRDEKLFIFDDTLMHQSVNESDGVRYCLFVDILRPSLVPWLFSGILTGIRLVMLPVRAMFYKHWDQIK